MPTAAPLKVLVVDDSVVIRKIISEGLGAEPGIRVVTAANGKLALAKIADELPDIVTLDIEMPELDGLATLKEIRQRWAKLPVVMVSAHTSKGGIVTLDCLAAGATDYVTKPAGLSSPADGMAWVGQVLLPMVIGLSRRRPTSPVPMPARPARAAWGGTSHAPAELVAIGSSTGGPNALYEIFTALGRGFPLPIVIVQHMPPLFTRLLSERLDGIGGVRVREARTGDVLTAGEALIAPGGLHMVVARDGTRRRVIVQDGPLVHSCRPAVDVLFGSLPENVGAGVLAVVLTGMGKDGYAGAEAIKAAGGSVWVQDEATSVVWGMPGFIARANLADRILPLNDIGPALVHEVGVGLRATRGRSGARESDR